MSISGALDERLAGVRKGLEHVEKTGSGTLSQQRCESRVDAGQLGMVHGFSMRLSVANRKLPRANRRRNADTSHHGCVEFA